LEIDFWRALEEETRVLETLEPLLVSVLEPYTLIRSEEGVTANFFIAFTGSIFIFNIKLLLCRN
jgi:hypothetical protein